MYPVQMESYFLDNDTQLSHMVFMILNIIGTYLMDNCVTACYIYFALEPGLWKSRNNGF